MRFIHTRFLREDMVLGKPLYDTAGRLLLQEGTTLKKNYIAKIRKLRYNGVYISDRYSSGVDVPEVVSPETRMEAVVAIREAYRRLESGLNNIEALQEKISRIVHSVVDEILEHDEILINMVDLKMYDDYTFFHSTNVAVISAIIGIGLGMPRRDLYELAQGGLLHDLGKICIPDVILNKKEPLTDDEMQLIRTHPLQGYEIIKKKLDLSARSYVAILQHHEKVDGTGYPYGLTGERITLFGKILAIADVYDALTSDRPYRPGWPPSEALEYVLGNCGTHFEKELVEVFHRKVSPYPAGSMVELNDGRRAIVERNHEGYGLRPQLRVVQEKGCDVEPYGLDLREMDQSCFTITGIISH